ncbi:hypothetical protein ACT17Q_00665 [Cellulomonas sp. CW35]|uniref:hypothetical protein n=1 Tax=Cellulomonas sp. CW35 TaxID=3458249 RepID=UPI00403461C0
MRAVTRTFAAATSVALALTLAACGSSSDDDARSKPAGTPEATAAQTPAAPDAAAGEPASYSTEEFAKAVNAASVDVTSYRMTMESSGSGVEMTYEYEMVLDGDTIAMNMDFVSQGVATRSRWVDGMFYMNLGEMSQDKFVTIDPADAENPLAAAVPDLDALSQLGRNAELQEGSLLSSEDLGVEEVEGVPARHYRVTVDTRKYLEALGSAFDPTLAEALESIPPSMEGDYWVNADDRLVRTVSEFMGITSTTTMRDWNDPSIVVTTPGADELVDWHELEDAFGA